MRILRDVETARSTLLKRSPLEFQEASSSMKQRIKHIFGEDLSPAQAVARIIAEVRSKGDLALYEYAKSIDGADLTSLEVDKEEISAAHTKVDRELLAALRLAADRIRSFHAMSKRQAWIDFSEGGVGQVVRAIDRVGAYVPGGPAGYPSTVLMTVIPAKVAGVRDVLLTTPSQTDGTIPPATLVAAHLAGADRVFKVGGAQAVAALAFGTETIPKVDKICGPGSIFVQLAKKAVFGAVGIDGLYGPTETVIVADESANTAVCAADILAQAEHDPLASAILITTSSQLATGVSNEVERQLKDLDRKDIAAASLKEKGGIVIVDDMSKAIELVNYYAPEHLCLLVRDAWSYLGKIENAGGIFVGESSPETLGDYIAGPSHVMPTAGTARFSSPLTVDDFLKVNSIIALDQEALRSLGQAAAIIAKAEGFGAHALAVTERLN